MNQLRHRISKFHSIEGETITIKTIIILIGILLVVGSILAVPNVAADPDDDGDDDDRCGYGGWGMNSGWIMMGFMGLCMLGGLALLLFVIYEKGPTREQVIPTTIYPSPSQALKILDDRYARGEIPREEYIRMKQDLQ